LKPLIVDSPQLPSGNLVLRLEEPGDVGLESSVILDEQKKQKWEKKKKHYLRYINQTYIPPLSYLFASFGGHCPM